MEGTLTPGPVEPGLRFREAFTLLGRRLEVTCEITRVGPASSIGWRSVSDGPLGFEGVFTLEPIEGGTRLTYASSTWTRGWLRLVEPLWPARLAARRRRSWRASSGTRNAERSPAPA